MIANFSFLLVLFFSYSIYGSVKIHEDIKLKSFFFDSNKKRPRSLSLFEKKLYEIKKDYLAKNYRHCFVKAQALKGDVLYHPWISIYKLKCLQKKKSKRLLFKEILLLNKNKIWMYSLEPYSKELRENYISSVISLSKRSSYKKKAAQWLSHMRPYLNKDQLLFFYNLKKNLYVSENKNYEARQMKDKIESYVASKKSSPPETVISFEEKKKLSQFKTSLKSRKLLDTLDKGVFFLKKISRKFP